MGQAQSESRFAVLDALRIVMATVVMIGHMGPYPIFGPFSETQGLTRSLTIAQGFFFFGQYAVVVFFLISGFCIHAPFAKLTSKTVPVLRFYGRRYARILVPLIVIVVLFKVTLPSTPITGSESILWRSALWSIACEEILYALYPLIYRLRVRVGWRPILVTTFTGAAATVTGFIVRDEHLPGLIATTAVLLPLWLLGCVLAESAPSLMASVRTSASDGSAARDRIWLWRAACVGATWSAPVIHHALSIYWLCTALPAGVLFYFWLRAELRHSQVKRPWRWLVSGGRFSYSLYLVHVLVIAIVGPFAEGWFASRVMWFAGAILIFAVSYGYFLAVEQPSHRLARRIRLVAPASVRSATPAG